MHNNTAEQWPYQAQADKAPDVCPLCGQKVERVVYWAETAEDDLIDHLIYHKCPADEGMILRYLTMQEPDGGLVQQYHKGGWDGNEEYTAWPFGERSRANPNICPLCGVTCPPAPGRDGWFDDLYEHLVMQAECPAAEDLVISFLRSLDPGQGEEGPIGWYRQAKAERSEQHGK
jgi:hypothetical protein